MPILILARHGRTAANASGILAGRTAGVALDSVGKQQAAAAAERLRGVPITALVSSPMQRCRQTATILSQASNVDVEIEPGINECDYGQWAGRSLRELTQEPLWSRIQSQPASVTFPGGEAMLAMATRAVTAVHAWNHKVEEAHGADAVWVAVSHGDIIKAIIADALGLHLNQFQRITVGPASLTVITYQPTHAAVLTTNSTEGSLAPLVLHTETRDEQLGGGAGPQAGAS